MIESFNNSQIQVANSEQQLDGEQCLTDIEKHKLLVEWNNTYRDYPQDKCIHELFEATVERTPLSVAVVFEGEQLTYRELNARANQVAHYLQGLGVGPEVLVGICVERSLEMVVGVLGILKAGGAYVPLDPAYPSERLTFMLEDTQTSVLLTQARLVESLPPHSSRVVCLDTDWEVIARHSQSNPVSQVTTNNLAYVIYTSGSTGRPKGVAMSHRPLCNLLFWQLESSTVSTGAKTLQFAPLSFDVSFQEIFSTWCSGGTLVLISEELRRDAVVLLHFLSEKAIERLFLPFVALQLLAEVADGQQAVPTSLREIITAGEQLKITRQIANWFTKLKSCTLHNHYGPSESHVVTAFTLTGSPSDWPALPPIGRPIANTQIYLLSAQLQPVPVGVPGELYIGGIALARGYLNRPDLTDERFIPNPFSDKPGERLYKTGDLACYLPDGNIEFLGRSDHQVKIRGFRIELGEIEAALWQHPSVREAAVMAREDVPGDKRLVAYVVHNPQDQGLQEQAADLQVEQVSLAQKLIPHLRSFLQEKLPDYMVPSVFVMLDALPLTPNGKVDRRALPEPEFRPELSLTFVAPRTPIEEMLASTWACVLGIEQVGVHENFFELGGHSLLATQVISRVRDTISIELPLRSLFEAPTIAELAEWVENSLHNGQSAQAQPLLPIPRSESIPLSFAQARLWFLDQLQPNSAFYNIPLALRLSGQLNIAALQSSINEIIQRHEALRTNFATVEGQPVQVIASTLNCQLQVVNLLHIRESEREIEAQRLVNEQANRPFNLEREPLLRGTVLQLGETEYVLLLTMHHIISDGWSMGVFVRELTELYKAFCTGAPPSLPELPVQYADFALWQRQWLQGEILETQLDSWKEQLLDAPALLELPTDRPRPAVQTFRGGYYYTALSLELSAGLTALSKRAGVTLFMTLFAVFGTLLYRYSGQDDIVVGTPVANRNRREIEGLIGFFVNTLVLRTDLSGNPSFEQLLGRVKEVALQAYAHQDLPFEQLVEALQPTRDLSYTPLFQVMFALDDASVPSVELPNLTASSYSVEIGTAKFDLTLSMENTADGLVGVWEYNTDLFDEVTIARMAGHFQALLEAIAANPIQPISELPLLTQRERHQLLVEWNNTTTDYPQDKCIHQLFEEQVELTPDAVAVVFEGTQLTYRELNARANQLAHYLLSLGVEPEVLVGICVERSLEMVVGLLGILKAGGAYVPLDPAYPSERLAFMLEDSAVPVLLTQQRLVDKLPQHEAQVVCLDTQWEIIAQCSSENIACGVNAENLAYVIYTSGSTGKPKGVTIQHRSLVNYTTAVCIEYEIEKCDHILQFSSISFDVSAEEIYTSLTSGATLVLRTESMLDSIGVFLQKCIDWKITVLALPTAYWHELTAILSKETFALPPSLRLVIIGGEKALPERLKTWIEYVGQRVRLVNNYGPTEATVGATIYDCSALDSASTQVPIGRPIQNVQTYILDRYQQPVPIGVPGELHIGGDGLARGYLNRPDLTQEKFISNPFSNEPGLSLYKTGDQVRYLPDGNIEYLGRIDNQVKIRGFRIELGEIEAMLAQHPDVREAVVVVREDIPGHKSLVSYLVLHQNPAPTVNQLRHFLKQKLPNYMVPSTFVMLEALPLTPNGKVDHKSLPAPDLNSLLQKSDFVAPGTPTEELVASIWAKVLGVEQVGINDNFFELGGHSLLATQLLSQVSDTCGVELPLSKLFEAPTVASISNYIEAISWANQSLKTSNNTVNNREEVEF
jgi:amino acid adenylation domain-containing protein